MKIKRKSNKAIYMKEERDLATTPIITFMKARALRSLVTLNTLKVLNILIDRKADTALAPP